LKDWLRKINEGGRREKEEGKPGKRGNANLENRVESKYNNSPGKIKSLYGKTTRAGEGGGKLKKRK